jgi:hypothetical protein
VNNELEQMWQWLWARTRHYADTRQEEIGKPLNTCPHSQPSGQDLNLGPFKYKAGALFLAPSQQKELHASVQNVRCEGSIKLMLVLDTTK